MFRFASRQNQGPLRLISSLLGIMDFSVAKRLPSTAIVSIYTVTLAGIYYLLLLPTALMDPHNR